MSQQLSQADLELWAKRFALFHDTAEGALQVLRNLGKVTFLEFLTGAEEEWRGEVNNPSVSFPFNDELQQDIFFKAVEETCRAADGVPKSDHHMLARTYFTAQAGMTVMVIPGYAFPIGSQKFFEIAKHARRYIQIPAPMKPHTIQSLQVDEVISYTLPGSNEILKSTVTDIGTSRVKGMWFRLIHSNNPGVEVELNVWEMEEILARHVTAA